MDEQSIKEQIRNLSKTITPVDSPYPDAWTIDINELVQLIKQTRNNEIEALVTHIQDKFEEVEVLLNEYQYVRTRAIDAEDALTEGGDNGDSNRPVESA